MFESQSGPQRPTPGTANAAGLSDADQMSLLMAAPLIFGIVVGAIPAMSARATAWLLEHNMIIAATESPLLALPGAEGAGLDIRRLIVVAAVLAVAVALAVSGLRQAVDRRRQQRLRVGDQG